MEKNKPCKCDAVRGVSSGWGGSICFLVRGWDGQRRGHARYRWFLAENAEDTERRRSLWLRGRPAAHDLLRGSGGGPGQRVSFLVIWTPGHQPGIDRGCQQGDRRVDEIAGNTQGHRAQGVDGGKSDIRGLVRQHRSEPFRLNRCVNQPTIRTMTTLRLENPRNGPQTGR